MTTLQHFYGMHIRNELIVHKTKFKYILIFRLGSKLTLNKHHILDFAIVFCSISGCKIKFY